MSYEVDIRAVGEESKSGDAIVLRYGDFSNRGGFKVVVIDGGFMESGEDLVKHIREFYNAGDVVDLVISTHPDSDHVNGLKGVLEELEVRELWMHRPWNRAAVVNEYVQHGSASNRTLSEKLKRSLDGAWELDKIARRKNIPIVEPFAGTESGDSVLAVLGPSEDYYNSLVAEYGDSEQASARRSVFEQIAAGARKAAKWVVETWDKDELVEPEDDAVSPQNNSSVVLLAHLDDTFFLFTADAGVPSLTQAADYAESREFSIAANVKFMQGGHHGSKRNIGPTLLNRIVGPIVGENERTGNWTFISAAKKGEPKHPSSRVINAHIRRGSEVGVTQGQSHCYKSADVPSRPNWGPITPRVFVRQYEEEEG